MSIDKLRDARKRGFYIIDNDLIDKYGPEIGAYGVAVYNLIARYADGNGENSFPSYQTIAEKLGISRPKAVTTINQLVEFGLIKKDKRTDSAGDMTSNTYTLVDLGGGKPHLLPSKPDLPPSKQNLLGVVNDINQGGKPRLPDQDTINKTQIDQEETVQAKEEGCDKNQVSSLPSEEKIPAYMQPGYQDPMLASAQEKADKRKVNNGRLAAGWQAEFNLRLSADKRVPIVVALGKACGLTKAMSTDESTLKDVHEYAIKFYEAGCKTNDSIDVLKEKYLSDPWRKQNHPKPSLSAFLKFYSREVEEEITPTVTQSQSAVVNIGLASI